MCCKSCWGTGDFSLVSVPALGVGGLIFHLCLPVHLLSSSCLFFQSPLSIKCSIDSPDSPHSYHSLFFHCAIFQPCPSHPILISISLTLSLQSLLVSLLDSLRSMLSIHALSPTERDRYSHSSSTIAGPWTLLTTTGISSGKCNCLGCSLVLHWKPFLKFLQPMKKKLSPAYTLFFMSLTYIPHKSALNKDKEIVERYAYR